jgi:hypothetical protein
MLMIYILFLLTYLRKLAHYSRDWFFFKTPAKGKKEAELGLGGRRLGGRGSRLAKGLGPNDAIGELPRSGGSLACGQAP